jgi:hypothetical protein
MPRARSGGAAAAEARTAGSRDDAGGEFVELVQALGGASFLFVSAALSLRLFVLARRNRGVPELLLGLAFLCGGTLGAVFEASADIFAGEHAGLLLGIGKTFGLVGLSFNGCFAYWVFRRGEAWARIFLTSFVAILCAGYLDHYWQGSFETGIQAHEAFWIEFFGRILAAAWLGWEAALCWQRLRRRARIGLGDPVVKNRFLLWTLASLTGLAMLATSVPPLYLEHGTPFMDATVFAFGVFGLTTATLYWLAFFPPVAYRRWVLASAIPAGN